MPNAVESSEKTRRGLTRHWEATTNPEENKKHLEELTNENLPDGILISNLYILQSQGLFPKTNPA